MPQGVLRHQLSTKLGAVPAALCAVLAMLRLVPLALSRAAFANTCAQLANGGHMRAVAGHCRGGKPADLRAFHRQRGAVEHMFRMHISQTGNGAEIAQRRAARTSCNAIPVARFGQ